MIFSNARRHLPAAALIAAVAGLLGGCGTVSRIDASEQQIRVDAGTPVALDIENFSGNVRIVVDPTFRPVHP
jgi:hypothetical protein